MVYYRAQEEAGDVLWVNLYMGSTLDWSERGVMLEQTTLFPEEENVRMVVRCKSPARFTLRMRHPYWCRKPEVVVNGDSVEIDSMPTSYFSLQREWKDGDTIELRLPMELHLEALPHSGGKTLAIMHGPTVLAGIIPDEPGILNPAHQRFAEHLSARGKTDAFAPILVATGSTEVLSHLRPAGDKFGEFLSEDIVRPHDLRLVPFHRIYEEQYAIYLPLITPDDWANREGEIRAEREALSRTEAGTVDSITPGFQQPEVEHGLRQERSAIEDFSERKCRVARDGGWFSYNIAIDPDEPMVLIVTYWGGVWHERIFDIFIDGYHLAAQRLLADRPGDFFDQLYKLAPDLTQNRTGVVLSFKSRAGDIAGGVFGIKMMRASAAPPGVYKPPVVFKTH
jgi:hypothetical protein